MPRPDRFYWPSLEELAFTLANPSVQTFRQAISIDERRCMFRLKKWDAPADLQAQPLQRRAMPTPQDILQVWFAGVHADIGGGYPEKQSGLVEISAALDDRRGRPNAGSRSTRPPSTSSPGAFSARAARISYVAPDVRGDLHTSLRGAWWILEYLPKRAKYKEWPARQTYFGLYIPDAEPRLIPDGAIIHESVIQRMDAMPSYRPVNFAEAVREVSDAGAAGACVRGGGGRSVGWPSLSAVARRAKAEAKRAHLRSRPANAGTLARTFVSTRTAPP